MLFQLFILYFSFNIVIKIPILQDFALYYIYINVLNYYVHISNIDEVRIIRSLVSVDPKYYIPVSIL